jgi:Ca-activated chloride channel family protein
MASHQYFYADSSKKPVGPFTFDQLKEEAANGRVRADTKVIRKGDNQWISYSQITPPKDEAPVLAPTEAAPEAATDFSFWDFLLRLPKPIYFSLFGALGTLVGAVLGQIFILIVAAILPDEPRKVVDSKNICMVLDTSGSMTGEPLVEVKAAAVAFTDAQLKTGNRLCLVSFGSDSELVQSLSTNSAALHSAISGLTTYGGTALDLGLTRALSALPEEGESNQVLAEGNSEAASSNFVLIFTDGMPNDENSAILAAQTLIKKGMTLVVIHTPDAPGPFLNRLTQDPALVFSTTSGNFGNAFEEVKSVIEKRQGIVATTGKDNLAGSFLNAGGWFALIAILLALALAVAQNKAMRRKGMSGFLSGKQLFYGIVIGVVAGVIAGLINLGFMKISEHALVSFLGGVMAWCILGGIIASTMVLVIENFGVLRAILSGVIGGLLGGLLFNLIRLIFSNSNAGSNIAEGFGRLLGAVLVGALIGAFIAWIEQLTRKAWLEIQWTPKQKSNMNLGTNPVRVGGTREDDITIPGLNQTLSIICDGRKISCTQTPGNKTFELSNGQAINLGKVKLVACSRDITAD